MRTSSAGEVATREVLEAFLAQNFDRHQIADRLRIHPDSVTRALKRHGLREPKQKYTPAELERIRILALEGMPASWIAEDLGRTTRAMSSHLLHHVPRPDDLKQWHYVWPSIRRNAELLDLHNQFAPKGR